ncbi:MAG: helix-turn-helix transcriptional regulator [Planctomycetes bacterium]|nr:helix-turn-helix transcriptional regulator [Planctomycetota bacterium]
MTSSQKRATRVLTTGRDRIIAIAKQIFANQGFAQVSIRAIAAEAKCTISTVMYHAGSKQELLEACLDNAFAKES